MPFLISKYEKINRELALKNVTLVAVSKTKPVSDIMEAYEAGQRDFGENYVQELLDKHGSLPADIRWHFIGHLQSNKVKYIAPFVHLIHGVDSQKLLLEINKQGAKLNKVIHCLLQVHISKEETKFGLDEPELDALLTEIVSNPEKYLHVSIDGLMGMASFTEDNNLIISEFKELKTLINHSKKMLQGTPHAFTVLSMGMSADYGLAINEGSTMLRIGSMLFGSRIQ